MFSEKSNTILKYGLSLIMLLPLAFTPFTFFPWHFGKTMIFQIVVEVLAVLFLIGKFKGNHFCCHSRESGNPVNSSKCQWFKNLNWLDWSILFFFLIITLTSFTGVNPANSFWGNQARANGVFTWWHFGVFYFLLISFFRSRTVIASAMPAGRHGQEAKQSRSYFLLAVIVSIIVSITAIFPNFLPDSWQSISGGGIIGNRAFLASYLILAIGISLYLFANFFCHSREACPRAASGSGNPAIYKNKWRWLFLAAAVLFFYTIIDTGNRGALLGLVVGLPVGLALFIFLVQNRKIKLASAFVLLVFCSLFFIFFFLRQNLFLQRHFSAITALANISLSEGTTQTRLMAWESAWQGIKAMPFQGWGWGNYGVVFDKYYNPQFLKHSFAETVWDKPHNWLLEIGVTAGILGVIGYLSILTCAVYYLWRYSGFDRDKKIILTSTLIAYFVADLFLFETANSLILWFTILAFVSSTAVIPVKVGMQGSSKLLDSSSKSGNDKIRQFFVLFAILLIFYFLFLNFRFFKSSYYLRQAELSTALMDWTGFVDKALAVKAPFLSENAIFLAEQFTKFDKAGAIAKEKKVEDTALEIAGVLEKASSKYPDNLSFSVWAGQVYLVLGEKFDEKYYQKAEESLLKAEKISPNKQEVLFLLGRLYLLKKDFEKALDFQKKAVEVASDVNTSHWFLGLTYVAQGEQAKGLQEIEKAQELGYNLTKEQKLYVLDIYALEKNYPKLMEEYKNLIEEEPGNLNWYVKLAVVYAETGDKKSALEITRYAVGLFPPIKAEAKKFIKQYKLE